MNVRILDLDAARLDEERGGFLDTGNAEQQFPKTFKHHLKKPLAEEIINGNLDPEVVAAKLANLAYGISQDVCRAILEDEQRNLDWKAESENYTAEMFAEDFPVLSSLGNLENAKTLKPQDLDEYEQPVEFVAAVVQRVREDLATSPLFAVFEQQQKHPVIAQHINPWLKQLLPLYKALETDGLDPALAFIEASVHNPDLTIAPEDLDHLFFVLYLPESLRYLVQDLIINNTIISLLERLKNRDNTQFIDAYKAWVRTSTFANDHWTTLTRYHPASEESILRLAESKRAFAEQFEVVKSLYDPEKHEAILTALKAHSGKMITDTRDTFQQAGGWSSKDPGHTFTPPTGHYISGLGEAENVVEKGTQSYLILEDRPDQQAIYDAMLEAHSPYNPISGGRSVTTTPAEFLEQASDDIGFYLVDIQNGQDEDAGINVAKQLLLTRYRPIKETIEAAGLTSQDFEKKSLAELSGETADEELTPQKEAQKKRFLRTELIGEILEKFPTQKIVVWTSSRESYIKAYNALEEFCKEISPDLVGSPFDDYGLGCPLTIEVKMKSDTLRHSYS